MLGVASYADLDRFRAVEVEKPLVDEGFVFRVVVGRRGDVLWAHR